MRVGEVGYTAVREPAESDDLYRWKAGYRSVRGKVWFGGDEGGEVITVKESGERAETRGDAVFIKGMPLGVGWGVCVGVEAGASCDFRITRLTDRGAFWRAELQGIPEPFRG